MLLKGRHAACVRASGRGDGHGPPQRTEGSISFQYVTAFGMSRQTGLAVNTVLGAGRRLTEAGLTIEGTDGTSWRTDFESLRRIADREQGG
jgi:hypothetical protein